MWRTTLQAKLSQACRSSVACICLLLMIAGASAQSVSKFPREVEANYDAGLKAYDAKNYLESLRFFELAALKGHSLAMEALGNQHFNGNGVERNFALARKWYLQASQRGSAYSMWFVGKTFYEEGNFDIAFRWYEAAAARGSEGAMNEIGFFFSGASRSGKTDYGIAMKWFQEAYRRGDGLGAFNIGVLYDSGKGVNVDGCAAINWYEKSIELDPTLATANYNLGWHLSRGTCGKLDRDRARKLLRFAADAGFKDAEKVLAEMDRPSPRRTLAGSSRDIGDDFLLDRQQRAAEMYQESLRQLPPPPPAAPIGGSGGFYGCASPPCM